MNVPLKKEAFADVISVSRETLDRLELYLGLLVQWQGAINLVSSKTLDDPWRRHLLDSAQLMTHIPNDPAGILDLGSGAGLPGIVLSILGIPNVQLVESDQRKARFLAEVSRRLQLDTVIHNCRIEALPAMKPGIVTARALAPLPRLLDLALPYLGADGFCVFLKGRHWKDELTEAQKSWMMQSQISTSMTCASAAILKLWDIKRAPLHRQ